MNMAALVARDRSHPSVIMWSYCNEGGCGKSGGPQYRNATHRYDDTRPTLGNGINAVDRAMYGNRAGDTATYNSQGGGTVTNLGNGSSQRTSSKYGWTETTHADGSKSIKYK